MALATEWITEALLDPRIEIVQLGQQHSFCALDPSSYIRAASRLKHMIVFRETPVDNGRVSPHKHRITDYLRPKTLAMLLLGFSSGLPFLLVGNTFGYWLRD